MTTMTSIKSTVEVDEEQAVIALLARALYLNYCQKKGFTPNARPYVPAWAIDYANVAVRYLGYDDDAIEALKEVTR